MGAVSLYRSQSLSGPLLEYCRDDWQLSILSYVHTKWTKSFIIIRRGSHSTPSMRELPQYIVASDCTLWKKMVTLGTHWDAHSWIDVLNRHQYACGADEPRQIWHTSLTSNNLSYQILTTHVHCERANQNWWRWPLPRILLWDLECFSLVDRQIEVVMGPPMSDRDS
jgi:hypothetical protein